MDGERQIFRRLSNNSFDVWFCSLVNGNVSRIEKVRTLASIIWAVVGNFLPFILQQLVAAAASSFGSSLSRFATKDHSSSSFSIHTHRLLIQPTSNRPSLHPQTFF